MMRFTDLKREAGFIFGHRQIKLTLLVVFFLSVVSLWTGFAEMQEQQATIERLLEKDQTERDSALAHQSNYGSAAYYTFHLTYAPLPRWLLRPSAKEMYFLGSTVYACLH